MAERTSAIVPLDALAQIEDGLDVHRWIKLWEADGRKIDTTIAIAFYQRVLQDALAVLRPTSAPIPHDGERP